MESNTGFFCKLAAAAVFILSVIAGTIWGLQSESFFVALLFWAGALLFCLLLYAVGEILSTLTRLEFYVAKAVQNTADAEDGEQPKNGWTCKECGKVNPRYLVECIQCSTSKFS